MTLRFVILVTLAVLPVACSGRGSIPTAAPIEGAATPASVQGGPNLYVATNYKGREYTGYVTVYGLQHGTLLQTIRNGINAPLALAFDSNRNLYVANKYPYGNLQSGSVTVYAIGKDSPMRMLQNTEQPVALAFDVSGNLYVANKYGANGGYACSHGNIGVYAPGQIHPFRYIGIGTSSINLPEAITFDGAGDLYVANGPSSSYDCMEGNTVTIFQPGASTPFESITRGIFYPDAIALAPGVLYVANAPPHGVHKLPDGSVTVYDGRTYALLRTITQGIRTPVSLAIDGSGNLYVANLYGRNVSVYAPGASAPTRVITDGAKSPNALAFSTGGDLYVGNSYYRTAVVYAPGQNSPRLTIRLPDPNAAALALSAGKP